MDTVLYCSVERLLYCTVVYCTVDIVQYFTLVYCGYYTALYCTVLWTQHYTLGTVRYCTILFCGHCTFYKVPNTLQACQCTLYTIRYNNTVHYTVNSTPLCTPYTKMFTTIYSACCQIGQCNDNEYSTVHHSVV